MDQPSLALECYLRALEYEGENWDYEFWGRLYNQMGMLYAEQELYGKAMSFLRKASAQYQLLNDTAGQGRILEEVKKYEALRDSIGSLSARESIYQITSRYDVRPIREDLSKKELMLLQRGQERYLYAFIIVAILRKSEVYEKFHDRDADKIVSEDWGLLEVLLNKAYDDFTLRLKKLYPVISDTELKVCMLTKIGVPANQITRVLKYNSSVLRPRLFRKIFKKEGSTEAFVEFISKF